jgi:hypothetical protein
MPTWYIQIFPCGTTKRTKNDFNTIEARTYEKSTIGIGFYGCIPIINNDSMTQLDFMEESKFTPRQKKYKTKVFEYFVNEMKIGDTVYLKKGKQILYQATISSNYFYDDSDYNEDDSTHNINSDNITNGWFWRHRRTISNITRISDINTSVMRQTIYKR